MSDTLADVVTQWRANEGLAIVYLHTDGHAECITRAQLAGHAQGMARAFSEKGTKPGDLLILAHTQNLESIYAFWGAILIGAIPAMFPTATEKLDMCTYVKGIETLTRLSGARAVVTSDAFAPTMREVVSCDVWSSSNCTSDCGGSFEPVPVAPESIAFLQHSSGTTGLQKGVALTHGCVLRHLAIYAETLGLTRSDVIVSWLPLYHDMGLIAGFLMPLVLNIPLVLMSPFDWVKRPAMLFKAIADYGGTFCWLPNFAYNHCARRIREGDMVGVDLSRMRAFINCSEPVRDDSHRLFLERFSPYGVRDSMLAVSYAMAENVFAVTQTRIGEPAPTLTLDEEKLRLDGRVDVVEAGAQHAGVRVSCGAPVEGVSVRVVDAAGADLGEGRVGEIVIASATLLNAYYRRPDLTPIVDGWYRSGDRGFLYQGEVYVVGRSKDLIINAGKNIYPQDLEAVVNRIEGIHAGRVVAFGVPDEREGTELIAIVAEVDARAGVEPLAITKAIRTHVAQHTAVTVTYVHLVDSHWLIKTSSGKIARHANRDKWLKEMN